MSFHPSRPIINSVFLHPLFSDDAFPFSPTIVAPLYPPVMNKSCLTDASRDMVMSQGSNGGISIPVMKEIPIYDPLTQRLIGHLGYREGFDDRETGGSYLAIRRYFYAHSIHEEGWKYFKSKWLAILWLKWKHRPWRWESGP
jgi:hypothetical protein